MSSSASISMIKKLIYEPLCSLQCQPLINLSAPTKLKILRLAKTLVKAVLLAQLLAMILTLLLTPNALILAQLMPLIQTLHAVLLDYPIIIHLLHHQAPKATEPASPCPSKEQVQLERRLCLAAGSHLWQNLTPGRWAQL